MSEVQFYLQGDKSELFVYENRLLIVSKDNTGDNKIRYQSIDFGSIEEVVVSQSKQNIVSIEFRLIEMENNKTCIPKGTFQLKKSKVKQSNLTAYEVKCFIDEYIAKSRIKRQIINKVRADALKIYKDLLDCKAITQEEFDLKKKEILGL